MTVTAIPAAGWYFTGWTGDYNYTGTEEEITITMYEDKEITAHFEEEDEDVSPSPPSREEYTLVIDSTDGGTVVEPAKSSIEGIVNEVIELKAQAEDGYHFLEWIGDSKNIADNTSAETTITMGSDHTITAVFVETDYELTIGSTEGGEVFEPGEGAFGTVENEVVDLEAVAEEDYYFVGWKGDIGTIDDTTSSETRMTMDGDKEITAVFEEGSPPVEEEDDIYFEVEITDRVEQVETGENVSVGYNVTNTGSDEGTQDVLFRVNGEKIETYNDLTLGANKTYEGEFSWNGTGEKGDYQLEVITDDDTGSVTITVKDEEKEPKDDDGIPGFTSTLLILAVVIAIAVYHKKKG